MRYIIFDRDGTLIKHKKYLHKPEDIELVPGSRDIVLSFLKKAIYYFSIQINQELVEATLKLKMLKNVMNR